MGAMASLSLAPSAAPRKRRAGGTGEVVTIDVPSVSDELVTIITGAAGGSFAPEIAALAAEVSPPRAGRQRWRNAYPY